jgi:predicted nucleic acid-binding protein
MFAAHIFVETNFLYGIFRMPSKRHRDALALKARFDAGEVRLYVPYVCFQEARNLIAKSLPSNRGSDILEFHRFATEIGVASWDFGEVKKLLDAATGEVSRTKAVHQRELAEFATGLGDGILQGTKEVFDSLESLDLDDDNLQYNDKLILTSAIVKAKLLKASGVGPLYFASVDKSDLQPTAHRPKMARYYNEAGLVFVPNFVLPKPPMSMASDFPDRPFPASS